MLRACLLIYFNIFIILTLFAAPQPNNSSYVVTPEEKIKNIVASSIGFFSEDDCSYILSKCDSLLDLSLYKHNYDRYFDYFYIKILTEDLSGSPRKALSDNYQMYNQAISLKNDYGLFLSNYLTGNLLYSLGKSAEGISQIKQCFSKFNLSMPNANNLVLSNVISGALTIFYGNLANDLDIGLYKKLIDKYDEINTTKNGYLALAGFKYKYYYLLGDTLKAAEYANTVEENYSLLNEGQKMYACFLLGDYYISIGNNQKALSCYYNILDNANKDHYNSLDLRARYCIGAIYMKMGLYNRARSEFSKIYAKKEVIYKSYPDELKVLYAKIAADKLEYNNIRETNRRHRYLFGFIILACALIAILILYNFRDVVKYRMIKEKLIKAEKKAIMAKNNKEMLLSSMSHDIRTPLNAIVGFAGLLSNSSPEDVDEEQKAEFSKIIEINTQLMLQLLGDILDITSYQDNKFVLNYKKSNIIYVCEEVIKSMRVSYNLTVKLELKSNIKELSIITDEQRLSQVLINLIGNAIKYTKEGEIVLSLDYKDDKNLLFMVTDTGVGIPKEYHKSIFDRFEKIQEGIQGTGLGLSICKIIVGQLGGAIWIDPDYTNGARFCFTHPIIK